jgi:uncharacterized protein (TIGR02466 family)
LKNTNTNLLFPTPFYSVNLEDRTDKEIYHSLSYDRLDMNNGDISNDKKILDRPEFLAIRKNIEYHLNNFVYDILKVKKEIEIYFTNSWIIRHQKNDYSQSHVHSNSIFSGCYYLQVFENSGDFIVENNPWATNITSNAVKLSFEEYNTINSDSWIIKPKNGDLILFPSTVYHSVRKNESNNLRYCLSFNTFVRGNLGSFIDEVKLL